MSQIRSIILFQIIAMLCFISCNENDYEKLTYRITGRLIDSTNNAKFNGVKIKVYNTFTSKASEYLGECITNENGEFSLEYNLKNIITGNYLKLYFDTSFTASTKFTRMPIGESWNKNLYVGDSATLDIFLDRDLTLDDTLFIQTPTFTAKFVGPTNGNHIGKIRVLNTGQFREYGYAIGYNKYLNNKSIKYYLPTGDPIIDSITLSN